LIGIVYNVYFDGDYDVNYVVIINIIITIKINIIDWQKSLNPNLFCYRWAKNSNPLLFYWGIVHLLYLLLFNSLPPFKCKVFPPFQSSFAPYGLWLHHHEQSFYSYDYFIPIKGRGHLSESPFEHSLVPFVANHHYHTTNVQRYDLSKPILFGNLDFSIYNL